MRECLTCHMSYHLSYVNHMWIVVINIIVEPTSNRIQAHSLFYMRYDIPNVDTVISIYDMRFNTNLLILCWVSLQRLSDY